MRISYCNSSLTHNSPTMHVPHDKDVIIHKKHGGRGIPASGESDFRTASTDKLDYHVGDAGKGRDPPGR